MAKITISFGALLIALGLVGYLGISTEDAAETTPTVAETESAEAANESPEKKRSITALIPAFIGGALLLCGLIALNERLRMHAMHAAVLVGLLGALAGAGRGFSSLGKFLSSDPTLNQRSFFFVWLMAIICAVFVVVCVRSFLQARRQRQQEQAES